MSKYQKLDNALAPTTHDDDYDESFSVYFDDNQQHHNNNSRGVHRRNSGHESDYSNNNNSRLNLVDADANHRLMPNNNKPKYSNSSSSPRNNNNDNNSNDRLTSLDLEEHTWEVPLLSSDDNVDYDLHEQPPQQQQQDGGNERCCHSGQLGFGANLKSKSTQEAKFKILLAISLCCIFMIIEFLGGYMAGSLAIMTDAAHLASDCISFVIGLVAIWLGGRPPDARMSFGYKRFEVIGALASILGIWLLTAMLVVMAIERIYSKDFDLDANMMMLISGIGIGINIVMMFVLHGNWLSSATGHGHSHGNGHGHGHGHSHTHATPSNETNTASNITMPNGHNVVITNGLKPIQQNGNHNHDLHNADEEANMNLRAAMIHVIGDLVQSIGVFLAAVLIKFCPSAKFVDPLCTLLFSVIVIMTTVRLFRESVAILLDAVPQQVCLRTLELELGRIEGVKSLHHLNVWQHTSDYSVLMVHLVIDPLADADVVLQQATQLSASTKYSIKHATIQIERWTA